MIQLDVTMDDGNSSTGSMLAVEANSPKLALDASAASSKTINEAGSYIVCYGV